MGETFDERVERLGEVLSDGEAWRRCAEEAMRWVAELSPIANAYEAGERWFELSDGTLVQAGGVVPVGAVPVRIVREVDDD